MVQQALRRALGAVKDQTTIGLAKVSFNRSRVPALEVAIVKATSHDEFVAVGDKHVREIVQIMSFSRGYASVCVAFLARRLSRTKNWVVALKVLLLIHKLLLQDSSVVDSSFDDELLLASRRMFALSHFRDESRHPLSSECAHFVRNYALYIGEWLDCFVLAASDEQQSNPPLQQGSSFVVDYNDYKMDYTTYKRDEDESGGGSSSFELGMMNSSNLTVAAAVASAESDPKVGMLLNRVPILQHLLEHVLACSSGAKIPHGLVRSALTLLIRDSFKVYIDICDCMSTLLNEFFLLVHKDGLKALAVYGLLAKQADSLMELYDLCRGSGICGAAEYPCVQRVSREHLVLLDDYLKDTKNKAAAAAAEQTVPQVLEPSERISQRDQALPISRITQETAEGNVQCGESSGTKDAVTEEWEVELMKEANKLSCSLSMGRCNSLSPLKQRRRAPQQLSMPAFPNLVTSSSSSGSDGGSTSMVFSTPQDPKWNPKVGIGSPGSYGKLMNKHPRGYKHLKARKNSHSRGS